MNASCYKRSAAPVELLTGAAASNAPLQEHVDLETHLHDWCVLLASYGPFWPDGSPGAQEVSLSE